MRRSWVRFPGAPLFNIHATLGDEEAGPGGDPPKRCSGWKECLEALQEKRVEIKEWLQRNPSTAEKSIWIAYYE